MGLFADEFSRGVGIGSQIVKMMKDAKAAAYDDQFLQMQLQKSQLGIQSQQLDNQMQTMNMDEFRANAPVRQQTAQLGLQKLQGSIAMQPGELQLQQGQIQSQGDEHQQALQRAQMFPLQQAMLQSNLKTSEAEQKKAQNDLAFNEAIQPSAIAGTIAKHGMEVNAYQEALDKQANQNDAEAALRPYAEKVLQNTYGMSPASAKHNGSWGAVQMLQNLEEQKVHTEDMKASIPYKLGLVANTQLGHQIELQRIKNERIKALAGSPTMRAAVVNDPNADPEEASLSRTMNDFSGKFDFAHGTAEQGRDYFNNLLVDPNVDLTPEELQNTVKLRNMYASVAKPITSAKIEGPRIVPEIPGQQIDASPEQLDAMNKRRVDAAQGIKAPQRRTTGATPTTRTSSPARIKLKSRDVREVVEGVRSGRLLPGMILVAPDGTTEKPLTQEMFDQIKAGSKGN